MILYINACVRKESRTKRLTDHLIAGLKDKDVNEVRLWETALPKVDEAFINKRTELCGKNNFSDPIFDLAKDFANTDTIVIAAPYWDLSFPAMLKQYLEQICVVGLTFFYNEKDLPQTLCKARKLYYVTTAGGPIISDELGYGYVKTVAQTFFEIPETFYLKAEKLDLIGSDPEAILTEAFQSAETLWE